MCVIVRMVIMMNDDDEISYLGIEFESRPRTRPINTGKIYGNGLAKRLVRTLG